MPESYLNRVEKMYEFLMYTSKPDGTEPMLGDSWPFDVAGALRVGRDDFGREDMRWLLSDGAEGTPPPDTSHSLPNAGYTIMRSAWLDPDARWLLFDTSPWGGGHQQPDNLQVIVYAYGATLLPDSGSYLYYGAGRAEHARTDAHSTLTVDETNQDHSPGQLNAWRAGKLLDYADGQHEGYAGIVSRRRVLFARPDYWLILDTVRGEGEHTVDQSFQCAPGSLQIEGNVARLTSSAGPGLSMITLRRDGATLSQRQGWVSEAYTQREPRPVLRVRRQGALPISYLTVLLPSPAGAQAPAVQARELTLAQPGPDAAVVELRFADHTDYLLMADEAREFNVAEVGLRATCRAGLLRVDAQGAPVAWELVEGDRISYRGRTLEAQ